MAERRAEFVDLKDVEDIAQVLGSGKLGDNMDVHALTLFTWGYEGWGNWTDKLVEAVDALEQSRGWGPPLFVDIRASRKVRAEGFREKAFEKKHGPERYRWMNGLGNKAILTGEKFGSLIEPATVSNLLALAIEMESQKRRVIYFCSCQSPTGGCHRHWVAPHLLELAAKRGQKVTVVEWPGFETEPGKILKVTVGRGIVKSAGNGVRKSVPLGEDRPSPELLGLPWFTPVELVEEGTGENLVYPLVGPAQHRAGGWQLPLVGGQEDLQDTLKDQAEARESLLALPRSWPEGAASQEPFRWTAD